MIESILFPKKKINKIKEMYNPETKLITMEFTIKEMERIENELYKKIYNSEKPERVHAVIAGMCEYVILKFLDSNFKISID